MKVCDFCIDVRKTKKCKKDGSIAELIEDCFKSENLKQCNEELKKNTDNLSVILAESTVIGYLDLAEIRCYLLKPKSIETDECSIEVFIKIDHLTFEEGITKFEKKIKEKLNKNNLKISSDLKTIKIFPVLNNDIFNKDCRILAFFNKRRTFIKHWWPFFAELLCFITVIIILCVSQNENNKNFLQGIISTLFVTGLLELFTCYKTYSNKLFANYDDIWDPDETIGNSFEVKKKDSPDDCEEE